MEILPLFKALVRNTAATPIGAPLLVGVRRLRQRRTSTYWSRNPTASYYWNIWAKHFSLAVAAGLAKIPEAVAEFGPGDSCAVGLSALLSGSQRYRGFDAGHYVNTKHDSSMFPEIERLSQSNFPTPRGWPDLAQCLQTDGRARCLLRDGARSVDAARREELRASLATALTSRHESPDPAPIRVVAPWQPTRNGFLPEFDLVLSHTVAQYVPDLQSFFGACASLLKPGGWTTHQIDASSMGMTRRPNGHLAYPVSTWNFLVARQPYHPNRMLLSDYLRAMVAAGLDIVNVYEHVPHDALPIQSLASPFNQRTERDVRCVGAFVVARKPVS